MIDIERLLAELEEVSEWGAPDPDVRQLIGLCRQAAAAIRQLQETQEAKRGQLIALAQGLETLGKGLQAHV